ncbi:MAG: hypothetical protein H6744_05755 [Deltaproteobacteria bacterium]|nr:hypothetical protein [Deltaproteobacteria bacterium]MCB9786183.1 hypothetical protein [Deltaproteobacteria bacterium]
MRASIRLLLSATAALLLLACGPKDPKGEPSEGAAAPAPACIDYLDGHYSALSCAGKAIGESCSINGDRVCVRLTEGPAGTATCGCQGLRPGTPPRAGECPPDTSLGCDCGGGVVGMASCDDAGQAGQCLCPADEEP